MIKSLNDYTIAQKIAGDGLINIYHGFNRVENHACLVKIPVHEDPADTTLAFLKNDHEFSGEDVAGQVIRSRRIVRYGNSCLVEFSHYDVVTLPVLLPKEPCSMATFISFTSAMTELVAKIHDAGIIHRSLTPEAFLKSVSTGSVYLSNFYISSRAGGIDAASEYPHYYPQRCTYIAPEQTGNVDRMIDERSDLYSLGAVFYEIASGEPPFTDSNQASLLYSHITRKPVPLSVIRPDFPAELSEIILKLLEKNPADRYQSAQGLLNDLEECRYLRQETKVQKVFKPGMRDRTTRLFPVKVLHGRARPIRTLGELFADCVKGHTSVALITGETGVGKSRLIDAFLSEIDYGNIVIARGKADSSTAGIPYNALKVAIVDLLKVIIAQGNESVVKWRMLLTDVLAGDMDVITGFLPELQLIIGPCPRQPLDGEIEQGTRFKNALVRLLKSFLDSGAPFVLILDDLQWVDTTVIQIVNQAFLKNADNRFLLIAAGRGVKDDFAAASRLLTYGYEKSAAIHLEPLTLPETGNLIRDLLGAREDDLADLSEAVFIKTGGNPFFVAEFIEMLLERQLLFHQFTSDRGGRQAAASSSGWKWNTAAINAAGCTDNLLELLISKAERLPEDTLNILKIAACIGSEFDITIVAAVICKSSLQTTDLLTTATIIGMIQRKITSGTTINKFLYQFMHEGLREALYGKIGKEELSRLHLLIGRSMLHLESKEGLHFPVYDIVRHFNSYEKDVTDPADRRKLTLINRSAAIHARDEHAYRIAVEYCLAARNFLECEVWKNEQELIYSIGLLHAECEYLAGNISVSLELLDKLEDKTVDRKQLARIELIRMSIYDHQQNLPLSLQTGFRCIGVLGAGLPETPSMLYIGSIFVRSFSTVRIILQNKKGVSGQRKPPEEITLAFRILCRMWLQAFTLNNQKTVASITMHLIRTTGIFGECGATSVAICFWGVLMMLISGNPRKGLRYADYALEVARRNDDPFSRGITTFLYGSFFSCYQGHIDIALATLDEGKKISYEAGDIVSASNCAEGYLLFMALCGKNLVDVRKKTDETMRFLQEVGVALPEIKVPAIIRNWIRSVQNSVTVNAELCMEEAADEAPIIRGVMLLFAMITAVIGGEGEKALRLSKALAKNPLISPHSYFYYLYMFIKLCALSLSAPGMRGGTYYAQIRTCLGALKKAEKYSPVNFTHCHNYARAECQAVKGNRWNAWKLFREAIENATEQGFIMHAAIIAERQAAFVNDYQSYDARIVLKNSLQLYREWGAFAKAEQLSGYLPDRELFTDHHSDIADVDLQALVTSFEAISNELILDRLLEKLVRIIMENAGAQRGVLLLERHNGFYVRVEGDLTQHEKGDTLHLSIKPDADEVQAGKYPLPHSIISFTAHTREPVRLEHAAAKGPFVHDHYIRKHGIKSVLCLPLFANERTRAIIYLENNLIEGAFPPVKQRFLRLLCGQAIIAIENALFHEMEIKHLQSKVNPHFLFNALSSIAELCHSDAGATEDAIVKLSSLYRYVLTAEMRMVSLEEELEIIAKYLAIEKLRFGGRLTYDVSVDGDSARVFMPSMIIQPLVENSIKHAISPNPDGGSIKLSIVVDDLHCKVTVQDSGKGSFKKTHGTGYGLESISKRLHLHYADNATIEVDEIAGFTVVVKFPVDGRKPQP